jgi:MFS family permease
MAAKIGKRPTLLIACAVFLGGLVWNMVTTTYSGLLCSRIVQGFGAAASHGLVPGTVSDVSFLHERATKLAIYEYVPMSSFSKIAFVWEQEEPEHLY